MNIINNILRRGCIYFVLPLCFLVGCSSDDEQTKENVHAETAKEDSRHDDAVLSILGVSPRQGDNDDNDGRDDNDQDDDNGKNPMSSLADEPSITDDSVSSGLDMEIEEPQFNKAKEQIELATQNMQESPLDF